MKLTKQQMDAAVEAFYDTADDWLVVDRSDDYHRVQCFTVETNFNRVRVIDANEANKSQFYRCNSRDEANRLKLRKCLEAAITAVDTSREVSS